MIFALNGHLYGGFGAIDASLYPSLNQALVPYLSKPVYLRLVSTLAKAKNYAAAGFHVSVTRGLGGGCKDAAATVDGTDSGGSACLSPLGRDDAAQAWSNAAQAYLNAYNLAAAGSAPLADVKAALDAANVTANSGYAIESVEPPSDPVLVAQNAAAGLPPPPPEPVAGSVSSGHPWLWGLLAVAATAGVGVAIYKGAKARTKRKSQRAYQYAY
jgi:hypothetical protein